MKIDWRKKLSSRKFWACIIGVVLSVMVMFGVSESDQTKVTGLITACSTLVIYILAESNVDAKHTTDTDDVIFINNPSNQIPDIPDKE